MNRNLSLGLFLLSILLSACTPTHTEQPPTPTTIPSVSPTLTPTITLTPTPNPTVTSTSVPDWVTDFAQPILDAIADRPPSFQDDFGRGSAGWRAADWCGQRMKYVKEELVVTSCTAERPGLDYPDFVMEIDGRFLPDTNGNAVWAIEFRHLSCPHCAFGVDYHGGAIITLTGKDDLYFDNAAFPGYDTNHLLMIAKGGKFAFYINNQPFYYLERPSLRWGGISFSIWEGGNTSSGNPVIVAFDNIKVWNIYDLP